MSTVTAFVASSIPQLLRTPLEETAPARLTGRILRNMFGLDYRSLGLLRIGLGILILCQLYVSVWDLRGLYSDEGMMPRSLLLANYGPVLSLYMGGGSMGFLAVMFAVQALLALMLIVGHRTRIATIASYVMLLSLQARNPILVFGPDITMRVCFFWAMFLPLNRRFSLDAALGRAVPPKTNTYLGMPGVAYIVQFALVYIFSGVLKAGPTWTKDFSAVARTLTLEVWSRPLGAWLNQFDSLTTWITILTPPLEVYGPLLLILPLWSGTGRVLALLLFTGLQLGFNLTMQMGMFGPVMITVSVALLPAGFWTYLAEPLARWFARIFGPLKPLTARFRDQIGRRRIAEARVRWKPYSWPRLLSLSKVGRDGVLALLVIYIVFWNLGGVPGSTHSVPAEYAWIGPSLGIDQFFDFFTPDPHTDDGWFVIVGNLKNGRRVNAFTGESTVSFEKPASVYSTYVDQRWSAFLICFWGDTCNQYMEPFSKYLALEWNRHHTGPEQMKSIEISYMRSFVTAAHTRTPVTQELLWTENF